MNENSLYDKKSLREISGKNADWKEVAKDCVGFSNAQGGCIDYGIEDDDDFPPVSQVVPVTLLAKLLNQVQSKTVNVAAHAEIIKAENGGEFLRLHISRGLSAASTSSGKYYIRIGDNTLPLIGDEIIRLTSEKGNFKWETQETRWTYFQADKNKLKRLLSAIRDSDRVGSFVKQKEDKELLSHFFLIDGDTDRMTNLGVLFMGTQTQRGRLMNAPVVQCIKYDENGEKVQKYLWDDYSMAPNEIIEDIWERIPDWKETNEIGEGLFRKDIPAYDNEVIRELACNALVHRPYTMAGDIFINIHPDRVEFTNPGPLPLGVTSENILHKTVKRNDHYATLCYVLHLMEREGSGYDKIFEIQLRNGKQIPLVKEGPDSVTAIVRRRIINPDAVNLIKSALNIADLKQKQIICLGLIAQYESISAALLIKILDLKNREELSPWLDPLLKYDMVQAVGRHKAKEYRVNQDLLRQSSYKGKTTLKRVENYRIKELIIEDLRIYECAPLKDIHCRIGKEIPYKKILAQIKSLVTEGIVKEEGVKRWSRYRLIAPDHLQS